jgi:hypothetical protein
MHSAILAINFSASANYAERERWQNFAAMIAKATSNPAVREIAPTVWQVDFQKSPGALAHIVVACEKFGYGYGILPFDGEPPWLDQAGEHPTAKTG